MEVLEETYKKKMCTNCKNKCSKCTLEVNRFYQTYRGDKILTTVYKCEKYQKSN